MATKKIKDIEVTLIGCEAVTLSASDTATDPNATYALDSFKAEKQMAFENEGNKYFVPFHAVDHIVVNESEAEVADKSDPYGCGGGTEPIGEVGFRGTIDTTTECEEGRVRLVPLNATGKVDVNALVANADEYSVAINGVALPYFVGSERGTIAWWNTNDESTVSFAFVSNYEEAGDQRTWHVAIPCDLTGEVEVTVTKK